MYLYPLPRALQSFQYADSTMASLPNNILQAVSDSRAQRSEHDAEEVESIVRAIELSNPQLCFRFDAKGLGVLCSVVLYSQACLAQQRGLFLLVVSVLHSSAVRLLMRCRRQSTQLKTHLRLNPPSLRSRTRRLR